jgi:hypothetical protein
MNNKKIDILVLPELENVEEILRGVSQPVELSKGNYANLQFSFKSGKVSAKLKGKDLKEFSFAWLSSYWASRTMVYAVKLYLDHYGIAHTFAEKSTSKLTDLVKFAFREICIPNTFFTNKNRISDDAEELEKTCGYPMIMKDIRGSRGKDSAMINNREELISKTADLPKTKKFLFQQFIPNEYDWGVLVADGVVVSGEMSYRTTDEFRNHALHGAKEVFVDVDQIPAEVKEMALKASKVLGLSWSRSDILINKYTKKAYLLEVNRAPGLTSGSAEIGGAQNFLNSHLMAIA